MSTGTGRASRDNDRILGAMTFLLMLTSVVTRRAVTVTPTPLKYCTCILSALNRTVAVRLFIGTLGSPSWLKFDNLISGKPFFIL